MDVNYWVDKVHKLALEKGWWENRPKVLEPRDRLSIHMLIVTEVAEASEAVRDKRPPIFQIYDMGPLHGKVMWTPANKEWSETLKPDGEAIELADVVIRVMDYFGFMGWDLEEAIAMKHNHNVCRSLRHGGKTI